MTDLQHIKQRVEGLALEVLAANPHSALMLGRKISLAREDASKLLQRLLRRGHVEFDGAWMITNAGRSALLSTQTKGERE